MTKIKKIEEIVQNSEVLYNEPLRKYSFTKTGGNAEVLVKLTNEQDLQNVIKYSNENNIELTILGNGSNVLISDNGISGIVALTSDMNKIELLDGDVISCYAGLTLKELTDFFMIIYHSNSLHIAINYRTSYKTKSSFLHIFTYLDRQIRFTWCIFVVF